jgi:hypothetical protein
MKRKFCFCIFTKSFANSLFEFREMYRKLLPVSKAWTKVHNFSTIFSGFCKENINTTGPMVFYFIKNVKTEYSYAIWMLLSNLYTSKLLESPSRLSFPSIHNDHGSMAYDSNLSTESVCVLYLSFHNIRQYTAIYTYSSQYFYLSTAFRYLKHPSVHILHPPTASIKASFYLCHPANYSIHLSASCIHQQHLSTASIYLQHPLVDSVNLPTISRCLRCRLGTIISSTSNYFRERFPIFAKVFVTTFAKTYF